MTVRRIVDMRGANHFNEVAITDLLPPRDDLLPPRDALLPPRDALLGKDGDG